MQLLEVTTETYRASTGCGQMTEAEQSHDPALISRNVRREPRKKDLLLEMHRAAGCLRWRAGESVTPSSSSVLVS